MGIVVSVAGTLPEGRKEAIFILNTWTTEEQHGRNRGNVLQSYTLVSQSSRDNHFSRKHPAHLAWLIRMRKSEY